MPRLSHFLPILLLLFLAVSPASALETLGLTSWAEGPAKKAINDFVSRVTNRDGPDYVPPAERIAVFDNDGTLWPEQPLYVQLAFALDRVKALAPKHPEWKTTQPFKAALEKDFKTLGTLGTKAVVQLVTATHSGETADQFNAIVKDWLVSARHPRFDKPYTELAYQPMLELLAHLRANGFKTYIVSGSGIEFMRAWTEAIYGVPPEQVIGSVIQEKYEIRNGKPELIRLPQIDFIDDKAGKPVGIHRAIGRRPIAAFGNSDGDFQMLEWTTTGGPGPRLGLIVHHDDAEREWAYDRDSPFGRLAQALDAAPARGWVVVSMKRDWRRVFPFQPVTDGVKGVEPR
jgi:hypothetical protein